MGDHITSTILLALILALSVELAKESLVSAFHRIAGLVRGGKVPSTLRGYWITSLPIGFSQVDFGDHIVEIMKIRPVGKSAKFRCHSYRYGDSGFKARRCMDLGGGTLHAGTFILPYAFDTGVPSEVGTYLLTYDHPIENTPSCLSGYFAERANEAMRGQKISFYCGRLTFVELPKRNVSWRRRLLFRIDKFWFSNQASFFNFLEDEEVHKALLLSRRIRGQLAQMRSITVGDELPIIPRKHKSQANKAV